MREERAIKVLIARDIVRAKDFWQTVGELDYEASAEERIKVTQNIRDWFKKRDAIVTPAKP